MPAGNAQQVWFPEMLNELKSTWSSAMTWEELPDLCRRMTEKLRDIRQTKGIKPPRIRCLKCRQASRSDISGVSIRPALFALKNNCVVTSAGSEELNTHPHTIESWHNLIELYEAWDKPERAKERRAKLPQTENMSKQVTWLQNGPNFFAYKTSDLLDTQCRQNVSTDLDFAHFRHGSTSIICLRADIL